MWGRPGLLKSSLLAVVLAISGCSDPTAGLGDPVPQVKGKVTLDTQPASEVELIFTRQDTGAPPEYRNYTVTTNSAGEYTIENMYPAKYKVMVYDRKAEARNDAEGAPAMDTGPYSKYGMESPLVADVSKDKAEHNFDLVSK